MSVKTLKINGFDVSARADASILEAAREHNIYIPTLCYLEGLSNVGSCRLCLVEIVGRWGLVSACTTRVEEGMEVLTDSEQLAEYRKMVIEMLFAEGNHNCAVCVSNGECSLQALAYKLGMTNVSLEYHNVRREIDASHDRYAVDPNRCILCTRCVRVCDEIEGAHTWDVLGRGTKAQVITDLNTLWGESQTCTSCGKCIQVCPTGALFKKSKSAAEMKKEVDFVPYLKTMREVKDHG
ncbi:MAG: bidirectional hydrogenase complex protein HoxU [Anaerolineales bacterium]